MEEYEELREEHYAGQEERNYLTLEKAALKRKKIDFVKRPPMPAPLKAGITVVSGTYELDDVLDYIDWNPFFQVGSTATELAGIFCCSCFRFDGLRLLFVFELACYHCCRRLPRILRIFLFNCSLF